MHKIVDGEVFFWLTLRAVDSADPFNGMWHYPGTVDRCGDHLIGGIRRVLERELGGGALQTCSAAWRRSIPVQSRRSDILSVLFLCTVSGEPSSAEQGRWFSATEAMGLVPLAQRPGRHHPVALSRPLVAPSGPGRAHTGPLHRNLANGRAGDRG